MTRIQPLVEAAADEQQIEMLKALPDMQLFRTLAYAPAVARGFVAHGISLLYESSLDPIWRELVILAIAHERNNRYEINEHERIALEVNCPLEKIEFLRSRADARVSNTIGSDKRASNKSHSDETASDVLTLEENTLIGFAMEMVREGAPTDAAYARVAAILSEQEMVELVACIAFYWGAAMFIDAFALEPEADGHDDNVKINQPPGKLP
ncbi:MAG: carboxymuconolactone decarboxylase family protein [Pseudomonadota bacterium]